MSDPFEIPDFLKRDTPERRAAFDEARRATKPTSAASIKASAERGERIRYHNGVPLPREMTPAAWAILKAGEKEKEAAAKERLAGLAKLNAEKAAVKRAAKEAAGK